MYLWKWIVARQGSFWSRKTVIISESRDVIEVINWTAAQINQEFDMFQLFISSGYTATDGSFRLLSLLGSDPNEKWSLKGDSSESTIGITSFTEK